jgi:hypothetical protein
LIDIIKNYIKSEKGPLKNQLKNVFNSLSLTSKNDRKVEKQIYNSISKVDKFIADDDLYGLLAYCNRNELVNFACPISWSVKNDLYDPKILRSHLTVTKLPYYDLDLYVIKDTDSISRKQYKTFFSGMQALPLLQPSRHLALPVCGQPLLLLLLRKHSSL